jgi:hypothetical protein
VSELDRIKEQIAYLKFWQGIMVVTEGLFSMDSDVPNIRGLQELCREFDALLKQIQSAAGEQPAGLGARDAERLRQQGRQVHRLPAVREGELLDLVGQLAAHEQRVEALLGGHEVEMRTSEDLSRHFRDTVRQQATILYDTA